MAEACVGTANKNTNVPESPEEVVEMNTFKSNVKEERTRSKKPEVVFDKPIYPCDGKMIFNILCVGDFCGCWSKGVYIEDYMSSDGTISENPNNFPVIGASYSVKCLYDMWGKEIQIRIWNLAESEAYFPIYEMYGRNSDGAIVFWGPNNHTIERALKYKKKITEIKPDIPVVFLVDNVSSTPEKWMGQGLAMNCPEEMDNFCLEHGFLTWFEMLERVGGEKSVFGQATRTLIDEIISRNNTNTATKSNYKDRKRQRSCTCS